ncbi:O-acetyl-ADP-ribose deacetylase (regulator of RNase III) [Streptomyces sp. 846.5]|nr:macro domain-containing protein [Streptomyces sp. 846.5]TDT97508.1 O-acetyl-ADP-ribose deacetylase (regulator of RNase III) [Streptomyces sp. 846.5]
MTQEISYLVGDATVPQGEGPKIIAHVCNDAGGWGKGFVLPLARRWPQTRTAYKTWYRDRDTSGFALGAVQFVPAEDGLLVANMIGQHGYRPSSTPPVRYEAISAALATVADRALQLRASVHMPRIGCGLAGGRWELVEPLIVEQLTRRGVPVTVYDSA